jgi:hypothetical protein
MNVEYRNESVRPSMSVFCRRLFLGGAIGCALALLPSLNTVEAQAQGAKTLKLKNTTSQAVEYGLGSPSAPPMTTIVIQPGQTRILYPVPGRDALWYRFNGTRAWASPYAIPSFADPVYKWKFVPSGGAPGLVGAPEIP